MRPENRTMTNYLESHGIHASVKYTWRGSLKGTWRLFNQNQVWSLALGRELEALGFRDFNGNPFGPFSGNGGKFSVFVRGHQKMISGVTPP